MLSIISLPVTLNVGPKGLPFVCHIFQVSGSSLPALLFGVGSIDQIKLQAEVKK